MAPTEEVAKKADFSTSEFVPKHIRLQKKRHAAALEVYGHGKGVNVRKVNDKKLRRTLHTLEKRNQEAAVRAKDAEILHEYTSGFLEPENDVERTWRVRQQDIVEQTALTTAAKRFELDLTDLGPYRFDYSRNGRDLLLGGRKGHIATMDWREGKLQTEIHVRETVRDVTWLHNNQYFAVAQHKYVYIYDHDGVELHCLRKHQDVTHLTFLPYHFLLASLSTSTFLRYQDTSTGRMVAEIPTKMGTPVSLAQNPWNAIVHVGHQNGTVSLWSPNTQEPLVKLLAHRGPVRSMAVDRTGHYMVTAGQDNRMAVWDVRMFREVNNYFTRKPASSLSISDTGLTAVGWGTTTTVWKDLFSSAAAATKVAEPYMSWGGEGKRCERVQFCPFDDVLGVGHDRGFSSLLIPGAGEANFDALEANPYETVQQRRETEVRSLLNKLPSDMISLDPDFIGRLDSRSDAQKEAARAGVAAAAAADHAHAVVAAEPPSPVAGDGEDGDAKAAPVEYEEVERKRMRGKNSATDRFLRKQQRQRTAHEERREKIGQHFDEHQQRKQAEKQQKQQELGPVLSRFV